MISIDAKGLACPAPVIEAKQAIKALPPEGGLVQVLVDNPLSAENLERMSAAVGYSCMIEESEGTHTVTIAVGEHTDPAALDAVPLPSTAGRLVIAIGKKSLGEGDPELGEILMKSFLYTLANQSTKPQSVLLFHGGIHLVKLGANTVTDLQALAASGTRILVCGACLDYYNTSPAVGTVATMLDIMEEMARADKVLTL